MLSILVAFALQSSVADAENAWRSCLADSVDLYGRSTEAAPVIATAALGRCSAKQATLKQVLAERDGSAQADQQVREMREENREELISVVISNRLGLDNDAVVDEDD